VAKGQDFGRVVFRDRMKDQRVVADSSFNIVGIAGGGTGGEAWNQHKQKVGCVCSDLV